MIHSKDNELSWTQREDAAFRLAMDTVVERARRCGTPIAIWRDERVTEITPDEAEAMLAEHDARVARESGRQETRRESG